LIVTAQVLSWLSPVLPTEGSVTAPSVNFRDGMKLNDHYVDQKLVFWLKF